MMKLLCSVVKPISLAWKKKQYSHEIRSAVWPEKREFMRESKSTGSSSTARTKAASSSSVSFSSIPYLAESLERWNGVCLMLLRIANGLTESTWMKPLQLSCEKNWYTRMSCCEFSRRCGWWGMHEEAAFVFQKGLNVVRSNSRLCWIAYHNLGSQSVLKSHKLTSFSNCIIFASSKLTTKLLSWRLLQSWSSFLKLFREGKTFLTEKGMSSASQDTCSSE